MFMTQKISEINYFDERKELKNLLIRRIQDSML